MYHGNNVKYYAGGFKFLTLFITWWQHHVLNRKIYIYISSIILDTALCLCQICHALRSMHTNLMFVETLFSFLECRFKYQAEAWPLHLLLAPLPSQESRQETSAGAGSYVVITRITELTGADKWSVETGGYIGVMLWQVRCNVQSLLVSTWCTCGLLSLLVSHLSGLWSDNRDISRVTPGARGQMEFISSVSLIV